MDFTNVLLKTKVRDEGREILLCGPLKIKLTKNDAILLTSLYTVANALPLLFKITNTFAHFIFRWRSQKERTFNCTVPAFV